MDLNIDFEGDYAFLKWIIYKHDTVLPYDGIVDYACCNLYTKNSSHFWGQNGVPKRVWNQLHKDLLILGLVGRINYSGIESLEKMRKEFKKEEGL